MKLLNVLYASRNDAYMPLLSFSDLIAVLDKLHQEVDHLHDQVRVVPTVAFAFVVMLQFELAVLLAVKAYVLDFST
jgi:hypothetical protein